MLGIFRRIKNEFIGYFKYHRPSNYKSLKSLWSSHQDVERAIKNNNLPIIDFWVSPANFKKFLDSCNYPNNYHGDRGLVFTEKCLEHYISLELLRIIKSDIYLDIASASSPFPSFVKKEIGCKVFRSDLNYPIGIHGDCIGGDSTRLPLSDNLITKVSLHCSFEHFEGDKDIELIKEIDRILSPGGLACIIPLYLHSDFVILTNPFINPKELVFSPNTKIIYHKSYPGRFGRFYDVYNLKHRILNNLGALLGTIYRINNLDSVAKGLWCHYALLLKKIS